MDPLQVDDSPKIASLVGGIIEDAQNLLRQEVALARREIQSEISKTKSAVVSFAIGVAVLALGGILLCWMAVHLLHWLTDGQLPLWGCFGVVGALFVVIGGLLLGMARNKANQIDFVPRQTVESMKENVQWIKNQT